MEPSSAAIREAREDETFVGLLRRGAQTGARADARVQRILAGPLRAAAIENLLSQRRQGGRVAATSWQPGS